MAGKYLDIGTKNYLKPEPEMYASTIGGKVKDKKALILVLYMKSTMLLKAQFMIQNMPLGPFHGWSYAVYISCLEYYNSHMEK